MNQETAISATSAAEPRSLSRFASIGRLTRRPETGTFIGMIAVFIFFGIVGGKIFLSPAGFASWLNIAAEIGIVALPVGLLMIAGELDISVGAVIPASSLTVAIVSGFYDAPEIIGIAAGLGVGLLVGFVNGLLVVRTTIPSLIITIGTMFCVMGLTLGLTVLIAGSTGVAIVPSPLTATLLGSFIGGMFQVTLFWWLLFIIAIVYLLHISPYGNWIFALGGDRVSARNAGIPTTGLTIALFMLSGFSAAFIGVSQVLVYQSAQVLAGQFQSTTRCRRSRHLHGPPVRWNLSVDVHRPVLLRRCRTHQKVRAVQHL